VVLLPESREPAPSGQELRGKGAVPAEPKGSALGRAGGGGGGGGSGGGRAGERRQTGCALGVRRHDPVDSGLSGRGRRPVWWRACAVESR
jgi:hypothetical protein